MVWKTATRLIKFKPRDGMKVLARGGVRVYAPRGEYQLSVEVHRADRQGLAAAGLRGAEGEAREGGPLRGGPQASPAHVAPLRRHRHLAHGRGDPGHPARAVAPLRQPGRAPLSRAGAGAGGVLGDRAGDPRAEPGARARRADRGARGRQPGGPVPLQRRDGGAGAGGLEGAHDLGGRARDRLHDRRFRGRPARAHTFRGRRARRAGQGGPGRPRGRVRPPPDGRLRPAAGAGARARGGPDLAPRLRGRARAPALARAARGRAGQPRRVRARPPPRARARPRAPRARARGGVPLGPAAPGAPGHRRAPRAPHRRPRAARVAESRARLGRLAGKLDSLSPLAVLSRGYALVWDEHGRLVREPADVAPGDPLRIRVAEAS